MWKGLLYLIDLTGIINERGVIIYVKEDIPSKILEKHKLPRDTEGIHDM